MKINTRSWHYRLYRYIWNLKDGPRALRPGYRRSMAPLPRSLCPYFWSIVFGLVGVAIFGIVVLVAEVFLVGFSLVAAGLGMVGGTVGGSSVATSWSRFTRRIKGVTLPEAEPKPEKAKRSSLFAAAARAQKDKVCPLIELED